MKKIIRLLLFVSLFTMGLASCGDDDSDDLQTETIQLDDNTDNGEIVTDEIPADVTAIAIASPDHTILIEALTEASLVETLQDDGPFTVFAPTNEAFEMVLEELGLTKEQLFANKDLLTKILLHHVVSGEVLSTDLDNGDVVTMHPDGADVIVDLTDGVMIDDASVITADLIAGNGVVHVIDAVLIPSYDDVTEVAINSDDHTILVEALIAADLVETLQGDGPYTVFAPTNDAFTAALALLDLTEEELFADKDLLTKILLYHVVNDKVLSTDLSDGDVATLNGQTIQVKLANDVMINTAKVTAADIAADNGVVHVVDAVLVPDL